MLFRLEGPRGTIGRYIQLTFAFGRMQEAAYYRDGVYNIVTWQNGDIIDICYQ